MIKGYLFKLLNEKYLAMDRIKILHPNIKIHFQESISDVFKPVSKEEINRFYEIDAENMYQDAFKNRHWFWDKAYEIFGDINDKPAMAKEIFEYIEIQNKILRMPLSPGVSDKLFKKILAGLNNK
jgi:hypothetical protein